MARLCDTFWFSFLRQIMKPIIMTAVMWERNMQTLAQIFVNSLETGGNAQAAASNKVKK